MRPFTLADAPEVARLAGAREVAAGTLEVPHPYPPGAAERWISSHGETFSSGSGFNFAIERRADRALLGSIGGGVEREHARAEIGYWIGVPYWGRGYATEAARAVIRFGFESLGLNRIYAYHFENNPASGRVLQKAGMRYEGTRRRHTLKWGEFLDSDLYAILRSEYDASR